MIGSLPLFHRIKGRKVLVLGDGATAEPKIRLIERAGGIIEHDIERAIEEGVQLAFIAYDDSEACENAASELRRAGMLVNVVDRPELCDFTTPSILDRDPVLIAVGTGGASAGLAKHLRLRLERILPQSLGRLADALFAARGKLRDAFPDAGDRRRAIDALLQEGGSLDPLHPVTAGMAEAILDSGDLALRVGNYTITVTVREENPDFLTIRDARDLGLADTILIDGDVPPAILAMARADARRLPYSDEARDQIADGITVILRWRPGE